MRTFLRSIILALGVVLLGASLSYAAHEVVVIGTFPKDGPDVYRVQCLNPDRITGFIQDQGPADNEIFGVTVSCIGTPKASSSDIADPGGAAFAEIFNCKTAKITAFCHEDSPDCSDTYRFAAVCDDGIHSFKQLKDN